MEGDDFIAQQCQEQIRTLWKIVDELETAPAAFSSDNFLSSDEIDRACRMFELPSVEWCDSSDDEYEYEED